MLLLIGMPSCGDPLIQPVASALEPSVVQEVLLDRARLKALATQQLSLDTRVSLGVSTSAASGSTAPIQTVQLTAASVRDTTVATMDAAGVLYPRRAGNTFVVWTVRGVVDSSLITVMRAQELSSAQQAWTAPALPALSVDARYPTGRSLGVPSEKIWRVAAGADLQHALDSAQPGDEIVLASGATFRGNFVLPAKTSGSGWIIVRAESLTVAAGSRMSPAGAARAAKIITPNQDPAIKTALGAHRWRLVGLEVAHATGAIYNYGIVVLGRGDETKLEDLPSEIILDRMYVHGSTTDGNSRCVAFNGRSLAVIDSWLSECHAKGFDAQGVGGWGGPGPFLIENNRIEASGQAVMFGGADPSIPNVSPSDITIRGNYMYKPLDWKNGKWTVKATFELKHAKRVLFENNVLENHWIDAQVGFAILLQAASQDNRAPWTTIVDVLIQNNWIRNSTAGVNLFARYNNVIVTPASRIAVINNMFQDVGRDPIDGRTGRIFQLLSDLQDVTILNNSTTLDASAQHAVLFDGVPSSHLVMRDNVFPNTDFGIFGSGKSIGLASIGAFSPDAVVSGNAFPKQDAQLYPSGNFFPDVGPLAGQSGLDLATTCNRLREWGAQQGLPASIGVDCEVLQSRLKGVVDPLQ